MTEVPRISVIPGIPLYTYQTFHGEKHKFLNLLEEYEILNIENKKMTLREDIKTKEKKTAQS